MRVFSSELLESAKTNLNRLPLSDLSPARYILELLNLIPVIGTVFGYPISEINALRQADPDSEQFAELFQKLFGHKVAYTAQSIESSAAKANRETSIVKGIEATLNFILVMITLYGIAYLGGDFSSDDQEGDLGNVNQNVQVTKQVIEPTPTPLPLPLEENSAPFTAVEEAEAMATETPYVRQQYTVQPGDTLSAIALRFNVTLEQLALWNQDQIWDVNMIGVGWVLNVSP